MRRYCVLLSLVCIGAFGLAACPAGLPSHSGYKRKAPWKKAKRVKFKEGKTSAEIEGTVSYIKRRRARWYKFTLNERSELKYKYEVTPNEDTDEFELPLEILDPDFRVISKTESDDEEFGALTKERELYELQPGTYYVHIYTRGMLDEAQFSLRIDYTSVVDPDPTLPVLPEQPLVPVVDPCGSCQCGNAQCAQLCPQCKTAVNPCTKCSCRSRTCKKNCSKCKRRPSRCRSCDCTGSCKSRCSKCVSCSSCDCKNSLCRRKCRSKCKTTTTTPPTSKCLTARVSRIIASGSTTRVTLNKGSKHGVTSSWRAKFKGISGTHGISAVGAGTSKVTVPATVDQVSAAGGRARICP